MLRGKEIKEYVVAEIAKITSPSTLPRTTNLSFTFNKMISKIGSPSIMVYSVKEVIEVSASTLLHTFTIPIYIVCKITDSNDIDLYLGAIVEQLESNAYPDYLRDSQGYPAVTDGKFCGA